MVDVFLDFNADVKMLSVENKSSVDYADESAKVICNQKTLGIDSPLNGKIVANSGKAPVLSIPEDIV